MSPMAPHISIKIDHSDEGSELFNCSWRRQGKNWFNLLLPRFQACWRHPITEPIGLGHSPLTLLRVDGEAVNFETLKEVGDFVDVCGPIGVENTDIISKKCSSAESEPAKTSDIVA